MTGGAARARRFSLALAALAARLLPPERAAWAAAMIAEVRHCDGERAALAWASGCVAAALKERMTSMVKGNLRVTAWVAVPEMLVCFAPLTIAFSDAVRTLSGMLHSPLSGGPTALAVPLVAAALAAVGPVGLVGAFRLLFIAKPIRARWLRAAVVAAPILIGVILLAQATGTRAPAASLSFDFWCGLVLLSVLPALGAAHLIRLSSAISPDVAPAP